MCIDSYSLHSVEPGKPTFCIASFVAPADMNFPPVYVLLKNIRVAYSIGGMEIFASQLNLS